MLQSVLTGVVAVLFLTIPTAWVTGDLGTDSVSRGTSIPLASQPLSSWPTVRISRGGKSEHIDLKPYVGYRPQAKGNHFETHYVYVDGSECAFSTGCKGDGIVAMYFSNTSTSENEVVAYAFMK